MTAREVFEHIKDYWENTGVPAAAAMDPGMDPAKLAALADKFLCVCRDEEVDGHTFDVQETVIDGHDQMCVRGTVLDVSDENSLIYPVYKKAAVLAKNIQNLCTGGPNGGTMELVDGEPVLTPDNPKLRRYQHLCNAFCIGCKKAELAVCVPELKKHVAETFAQSGRISDALDKANRDQWKRQHVRLERPGD